MKIRTQGGQKMTAKERLQRRSAAIRAQEIGVQMWVDREAKLRAMLVGTTARWEDAPGGGKPCDLADKLENLRETRDMANRQIDRLAAMRVALAKDIHAAVGDGEEGILLALRYVDGCQWAEIAEKMGYCVRQIYRMHGDALQKFDGK
jgi:hypothetical protein